MKKFVVTGMLGIGMLAALLVPGFAQSNTWQKAKDFGEKQLYSQPVGRTAGAVIGTVVGGVGAMTGGGVSGGLLAPTRTVGEQTELQQRNQAIQENMRNNGSPYFQPSSRRSVGAAAR
jgi:hypothetical protein